MPTQQFIVSAVSRGEQLTGGRPLAPCEVVELDAAAVDANQHLIDAGVLSPYVETAEPAAVDPPADPDPKPQPPRRAKASTKTTATKRAAGGTR